MTKCRRLTCSLAAMLAAAALTAPAASAIPDYPTGPSPVVEGPAASAPESVRVPGPTVVVEADESSGFDWSSAAVGAGIAAAMILLGGAAAVTAARQGRMRTTGGGLR